MGGKYSTSEAAAKGHHKGAGGDGGAVHITLPVEVAKHLHQLLTAALGGGAGKKPSALGKKGG